MKRLQKSIRTIAAVMLMGTAFSSKLCNVAGKPTNGRNESCESAAY